MKQFMVLLIVIVAATQSASAFDGKRDQWVIGGGIGYAPISKVSARGLDAHRGAFALQVLVGPALDEHNLLVLNANICFAGSQSTNRFYGYETSPSRNQGFIGFDWIHYYANYASSFFTSLGLGVPYYKEGSGNRNSFGAAIQGGGGYAFPKGHLQLGLYVETGNSSKNNLEYTNTDVVVLLTLIGF